MSFELGEWWTILAATWWEKINRNEEKKRVQLEKQDAIIRLYDYIQD